MSEPRDKAQPTLSEISSQFPHYFKSPKFHPSVYRASGSQITGDVTVGEDSSLWFNSVLRGDVSSIRIGQRTNIQDLALVHVTYPGGAVVVGDEVTVGHSAVLHACRIGNLVLIGMGSIILDGAEIEDNVLLGAGSLVAPGKKIPAGTKAYGRPARVVGDLSLKEIEELKLSADRYVQLARTYRRWPA